MSKAEWGTKRTCLHCGKLYYDMKKHPPVCPACKAVFDPETTVRSRRRSVEKKAVKEQTEEVIDLPVAEAEDAVIEDAEELADESVEEVVEVAEEES